MKICIVTYYGICGVFVYVIKALEGVGHTVIDFPLLRIKEDIYMSDLYDTVFINFVKKQKVDVVLWWCVNMPSCKFGIMAESLVRNIYFNWDDPFNWNSEDLQNKVRHIDIAFITCQESIQSYINSGCKKAVYLLCGHDPDIHRPLIIDQEEYACDISICCTNLYTDDVYSDQLVRRKDIIDDIYYNCDCVFHIYGPEFLKNMYPKSYRGYVSYEDTNKVFNMSKINLCTHVVGNKNKYINERTILIAGSGGLLLVDNVRGIGSIFDVNNDLILINPNGKYAEQVRHILDNYDDFIIRRYNLHQKSKQLTWNKWAVRVSKMLSQAACSE